jgi:hypothetical protein
MLRFSWINKPNKLVIETYWKVIRPLFPSTPFLFLNSLFSELKIGFPTNKPYEQIGHRRVILRLLNHELLYAFSESQ